MICKVPFLGLEYSNGQIKNDLDKLGAKFEILDDDDLIDRTTDDLKDDKAIGWFQGLANGIWSKSTGR